mgnify:CR=1 FL=1
MDIFKSRLASGAPLLGTFVKTPHPHVVEVLASTGLDCLCLDAEHAPFDRRDLDAGIMAARAGGMPVLVRPASNIAGTSTALRQGSNNASNSASNPRATRPSCSTDTRMPMAWRHSKRTAR